MKKGTIRIDKNDVVGAKVGKLTVIQYVENRYSFTKGGPRLRHYYLCHCDCGRDTIIQRSSILNQVSKSCGCSKGGRKNGN